MRIRNKIMAAVIAAVLCAVSLSGASITTFAQTPSWSSFYANGGYTVISQITLYPEETYRLGVGDIGPVTYKSSKAGIAIVSSSGVITAIRTGKTNITVHSATYGDKTCQVTVIAPNNSMNSISSGEDYSLTLSRKSEDCGKVILDIDRGVYVASEFIPKVQEAITAIENITGYPFSTQSEDKLRINIINADFAGPYITGSSIYCTPYVSAGDHTEGMGPLVHEMIHYAVNRNNGGVVSELLSEGIASYYTDAVLAELGSVTSQSQMNHILIYGIHEDANGNRITLTSSNFDSIFVTPSDLHAQSYFIVKYIVEKYGYDKLKQIVSKINQANAQRDKPAALNIIKSNTSSDFVSAFCTWFNKLSLEQEPLDLRNKTATNAPLIVIRWIDFIYGVTTANPTGAFEYSGSVTLDCTKGLEYADRALGQKSWGLSVYLWGKGTAIFQDANGKELRRETLGSQMKLYKVYKAAKINFVSSGDATAYIIGDNSMFDMSQRDTSNDFTNQQCSIRTITNVSGGIQLRWTKVEGADGYYIYRSGEGILTAQIADIKGGVFTYTDSAVTGGKEWTYTVRAYKGTYKSQPSETKTLLSIKAPAVLAPEQAQTGIVVKWAEAAGALSYRIYRKEERSSWTRIGDSDGTTFVDFTAEAGKTYYYTVRGVNGENIGPYNNEGRSITVEATASADEPDLEPVLVETTAAPELQPEVVVSAGNDNFVPEEPTTYYAPEEEVEEISAPGGLMTLEMLNSLIGDGDYAAELRNIYNASGNIAIDTGDDIVLLSDLIALFD